jgi:hypothetical protein
MDLSPPAHHSMGNATHVVVRPNQPTVTIRIQRARRHKARTAVARRRRLLLTLR